MIMSYVSDSTILNTTSISQDETVVFRLGWNYTRDFFLVYPVIHLFNKEGLRCDVIHGSKKTSQGIKMTNKGNSSYSIEICMKKLPSYVDSIYVSFGSGNCLNSMSELSDAYLELDLHGTYKIKELNLKSLYSTSLSIFNLEKRDESLIKVKSNKWDLNMDLSILHKDYVALGGIIDKEDLFLKTPLDISTYSRIKLFLLNLLFFNLK